MEQNGYKLKSHADLFFNMNWIDQPKLPIKHFVSQLRLCVLFSPPCSSTKNNQETWLQSTHSDLRCEGNARPRGNNWNEMKLKEKKMK